MNDSIWSDFELSECAVRYQAGRMTAEEQIQFELYLLSHPDKVEYLELDQVMQRCMPQAIVECRTPSHSFIRSALDSLRNYGWHAFAFSAVLFVLSTLYFPPQDTSPTISTASDIVFIETLRSADQPSAHINVPLEAKTFTIFWQTKPLSADHYKIIVTKASEDKQTFESSLTVNNNQGEIVIMLPTHPFSSGKYDLALLDSNNEVVQKTQFQYQQ